MFLALRSCSPLLTRSVPLSHHLKLIPKPYLFITSLSSFPSKPSSLKFKTLLFSPIPPNSRTMSSRPSAFEILMSNAPKKNKTPQQSSPPTKRKTQEPNIPNSLNPNSKTPNSTETEIEDVRSSENDDALVVKKPRLTISPDESVVELKKKAANFDPKKAVYWGKGEKVPFMFVVKAFDAISKESGRIAITEIVCNMLRTVIETTPEDLVAVVYLLANRIAPAHEGLELGIGDASIIKALAEACGAKAAHIKKQYKELGDLGLVPKASRSSQPLMRKPEAFNCCQSL